VIIGIATLPDEVLIESSSGNNSPLKPDEIFVPTKEEIQGSILDTEDKKNTDATIEEINALKKEILELKNDLVQIKINSGVPEDIQTITEIEGIATDENSEESQGRLINISIKDGVGSNER
jgi:hypothetical protein